MNCDIFLSQYVDDPHNYCRVNEDEYLDVVTHEPLASTVLTRHCLNKEVTFYYFKNGEKATIEIKLDQDTDRYYIHRNLCKTKQPTKQEKPMTTKLYPFHYKPMPIKGQDQRHMLVFGNLADAMPIPSNWEEHGNPPIKIPVYLGNKVCTWVAPQRLTLLEIGEESWEVGKDVVDCYMAFVQKFKDGGK